MTDGFYRYCASGCGIRTREKYCPNCAKNSPATQERVQRDRNRKTSNSTWKLYNCAAWKRFKESCTGAGNILCQRIVDGQQCRYPAEIWHHILSPRQRPDLMYSYSNVVGVCRQHHPVTEGESPENLSRIAEVYVPTKTPTVKF